MKPRKTELAAALLVLSISLVAHRASAVRLGENGWQQPVTSVRFPGGGTAVEIPARFLNDLVFLPVAVNQGQPSLFQLDSTAPASTIDPSRRAELGIAKLDVPVLNLSGVDLTLALLGELAKPDFGARVGRVYEGTLGNDFFASLVMEINYARQTFRLYDPASYQYAGGGKSLHLSFIAGLPVVRARISLTGSKAVEGDFVVDTALDASLLIARRFAETHNLRPRRAIPSDEFVTGSSDSAELTRLNALEIGPFTVPQSIAVFSRAGSVADRDRQLAGEIGARLLERFVVTFDYPHQQILLNPGTNFRADEVEDMSGLAIVASGPGLKRFEVTDVWPRTPGADAGIRKGDVIEGINGEAAADMSLAEIRALFRQPVGRYSVLIGRGAETLSVNLRMRRLLE
jgi:hypothetical protein